jgi:hypothetical protein
MRIKGVPLEEAAPNVQGLYRKVAERLGRVTIPLTAFAHCPEIAEAYSALGAALSRSQGSSRGSRPSPACAPRRSQAAHFEWTSTRGHAKAVRAHGVEQPRGRNCTSFVQVGG